MDEHCTENVVNMMTNEFSMSAAKKTYAQCVFLKKEQDDYGISDVYGKMLVLTFEDNEDDMMNRILSLINTREEIIQMSGMN